MDALRSRLTRERGNTLFRSACIDGLAPAGRYLRFQKALSEYLLARGQARTMTDSASTSKNIGSTHWKLALLLTTGSGPSKTIQGRQELVSHAADAEVNLLRAAEEGRRAGMRADWIENIEHKVLEVTSIVKDKLIAVEGSLSVDVDELRAYQSFLRASPECQIKAFVLFLLGVSTFKQGVADLSDDKDLVVRCLSFLFESRTSVVEARRILNMREDPELDERIGKQLDEVEMHIRICESRRAVIQGDKLLEYQMEGVEEPDFDMTWIVVDHYKQGVLEAREKCLESEALALSRLGVVYQKVIKMRKIALKYFEQALDIAESLKPMDVSGRKWHIDAVAGKNTIRRLGEMENDKDKSKKNEKLKEELKSHLEKITDIVKGRESNGKDNSNVSRIRSLLNHIYARYPPKLKSYTKGGLKPGELKKTLLRAIQHYHPDTNKNIEKKMETEAARARTKSGTTTSTEEFKVDWGEIGSLERWLVMCEEICRHLNFFYEFTYKGGN